MRTGMPFCIFQMSREMAGSPRALIRDEETERENRKTHSYLALEGRKRQFSQSLRKAIGDKHGPFSSLSGCFLRRWKKQQTKMPKCPEELSSDRIFHICSILLNFSPWIANSFVFCQSSANFQLSLSCENNKTGPIALTTVAFRQILPFFFYSIFLTLLFLVYWTWFVWSNTSYWSPKSNFKKLFGQNWLIQLVRTKLASLSADFIKREILFRVSQLCAIKIRFANSCLHLTASWISSLSLNYSYSRYIFF